VHEESHLDEMRDALRGDFERLAERRGEQGLLRVVERDGAGDEDAETQGEPETRSWLARLLSP
jgi:hypothetical protein